MSGVLQYLGSRTLGECVPLALAASAQLSLAIGIEFPSISAQLAGLLQLQLGLSLTPPSLGLNLSLCFQLIAQLEASIAIGLPSISFHFAAVAALLASLQLSLGALSLSLAFGLNFALILGGVGVFAYAYDGTVDALGTTITNATGHGLPGGTGTQPCNAILLVTATPATWSAMRALFGV